MRVYLVGVRDTPNPVRVVITDTSRHGLELGLACHEGVAVSVLGASERRITGNGVNLEDRVLVAID